MKLTKIKRKISYSIGESILIKCSDKTYYLISYDIWVKIDNEIFVPNIESIQDMQIRILNNLKNEIN